MEQQYLLTYNNKDNNMVYSWFDSEEEMKEFIEHCRRFNK
jgi:hypothetical protein